MASADVQIPSIVPAFVAGGLSAAAPTTSPDDVDTVLNYYKDPEDGSAPHPTYTDRPETFERPVSTQPVHITDVTGKESQYTLDKNGFQYHHHVAQEKDFVDDDHIKAVYYPETEQLLKDVTGASKIFIFDHTIRRQPSDQRASKDRGVALRGPVNRVHIDQTYAASLSRVPHHLPAEEAAELLKGRVQIINVWRPISTVQRDPLAIADAHSVGEDDLVPVALIYPTRKGETFAVRHSDRHRWYYKKGLTPQEVLLIKCFDSKTDGRARRVPHTAFVDPRTGDDVPARESIEVRALVFHPNDRESKFTRFGSKIAVLVEKKGTYGAMIGFIEVRGVERQKEPEHPPIPANAQLTAKRS